MQYLHIKNIEKYHPSYKDRQLVWCKTYFSMMNSDADFLLLDEIDKWRFIAFVMLELQMQKPVPLQDRFLTMKGFDLKKRSISLTIKMLHNFIDIVTEPLPREEKRRVEEDTVTEHPVTEPPASKPQAVEKVLYCTSVLLEPAQYEKLVAKFGVEDAQAKIKNLNNYIESKGVKYKSHYHTILVWHERDEKRK